MEKPDEFSEKDWASITAIMTAGGVARIVGTLAAIIAVICLLFGAVAKAAIIGVVAYCTFTMRWDLPASTEKKVDDYLRRHTDD